MNIDTPDFRAVHERPGDQGHARKRKRQGLPPRVAAGQAPPGITFAGAKGSGSTALDGSYVFALGINNSSGSEADTTYGSNVWSVQDNTNFFRGNNGHTDWVQFAFQYFGSGNPQGRYSGAASGASSWFGSASLALST
jgi:hypothetical protein